MKSREEDTYTESSTMAIRIHSGGLCVMFTLVNLEQTTSPFNQQTSNTHIGLTSIILKRKINTFIIMLYINNNNNNNNSSVNRSSPKLHKEIRFKKMNT